MGSLYVTNLFPRFHESRYDGGLSASVSMGTYHNAEELYVEHTAEAHSWLSRFTSKASEMLYGQPVCYLPLAKLVLLTLKSLHYEPCALRKRQINCFKNLYEPQFQ